MPPAPRVSGQRRYGPDTVERLALLKAAKRLGFTLEETQLLLAAETDGEPADRMRALARNKLAQVDALIGQLQEVRRLLQRATECRADQLCDCKVLVEEPVAIRLGRSAPGHGTDDVQGLGAAGHGDGQGRIRRVV
jgi:MerR family redox-sensitive transcriptional activator SoxR